MERYKEIMDALAKLKYQFPKDGFDRVFNIGIDAAIAKVEIMMETEGIMNSLQDSTNDIREEGKDG